MILRRLYSALILVALPFAFGFVLWRALRDRRYREGLAERLGYVAAPPADADTLWLHAVSLGEMSAAAPLVRELRSRRPQGHLVVTTATPTGRARARELFGPAVQVSFLPYDTPAAMRRFVRRIRPRQLLVMETELWPNLYGACARAGVPVVLASARLSERSVARYRRFAGLFRPVFAGQVTVGAQSADDAARFIAIGADPARVSVVGNIKFDIRIDAGLTAAGARLRAELFGGRPVWVAGSTHDGEEAQVLAAFAEVRARHRDALLVLVPRHPQRFAAVAALLARSGLASVRRSDGRAATAQDEVFLVDTTGELLQFYAAADIAFVGGSLVPVGGHNLLEPAALGVPVLAGPSESNGREIAALLYGAGAAWRVADAQELALAVIRLLGDPALRERIGRQGRETVAANRGCVERVLGLAGI